MITLALGIKFFGVLGTLVLLALETVLYVVLWVLLAPTPTKTPQQIAEDREWAEIAVKRDAFLAEQARRGGTQ